MTITKACLLVSLIFSWSAGPAQADQADARLDNLFLIMQQTEDPEIALEAENKIWQIWLQHNDQHVQTLLAEGIVAMDRNPRQALQIFDELIQGAPDFAEGWNKRATLYYLAGLYAASEEDIAQTLALEPRHFGALSGLGLVYLAQNRYLKARSAFEAVLLIHPHSSGVRQNIVMIDKYMRRNSI